MARGVFFRDYFVYGRDSNTRSIIIHLLFLAVLSGDYFVVLALSLILEVQLYDSGIGKGKRLVLTRKSAPKRGISHFS